MVSRRRRSCRIRGTVAIAAAVAIVLTGAPAAADPAPAAAPVISQVTPLGARRVALWVDSPAMRDRVQVQLLLPRDWDARPAAKFPVLFLLDGTRASDQESGWTKEAGAQSFYADKNVVVALPVGGAASYYTDWRQASEGKTNRWETFLTKELPPLLERDWRTTDVRGIAGLSMGGAAAMTLAARNKGFARFAASFSGLLTATTIGMPQAIQLAQRAAGENNADFMWGPPGAAEWSAHDPYELAERLKGVSLYISSGSGSGGVRGGATIPGVSTDWSGTALEILARMSSRQFAAKLDKLSIPVSVNYRAAGTHAWPYWDFEMRQSWPQAAAALGVER
ncbi:alpha/beta hydrolase [Nocardia sp. NPDC004340]